MDRGAIPDDVLALIQKHTNGEALSQTERLLLASHASRGGLPPEIANHIQTVILATPAPPADDQMSIGERVARNQQAQLDRAAPPPIDASPMDTARAPQELAGLAAPSGAASLPADLSPSPFDALGALAGGARDTINSLPDPVGGFLANIPGLSETGRALVSGQPIPGSAPANLDIPPPPPTDLVAGSDELAPLPEDLEETPTRGSDLKPPRPQVPGAATQRGRSGRRDMNPKDALGAGSTYFPELNSEFAGALTDDMSSAPTVARMVAEKLGGNAMTAQLLLPEVERAMGLVQSGVIGVNPRGKGLGRSISEGASGSTLDAITDWVKMVGEGTGTAVDEGKLYKQALRRAVATTPEELVPPSSGVGTEGPGVVTAQIQVTKGALLAGITDAATKDRVAARLDELAYRWVESMSDEGPVAATELTFPQFLKQQGGLKLLTQAPRRRREE